MSDLIASYSRTKKKSKLGRRGSVAPSSNISSEDWFTNKVEVSKSLLQERAVRKSLFQKKGIENYDPFSETIGAPEHKKDGTPPLIHIPGISEASGKIKTYSEYGGKSYPLVEKQQNTIKEARSQLQSGPAKGSDYTILEWTGTERNVSVYNPFKIQDIEEFPDIESRELANLNTTWSAFKKHDFTYNHQSQISNHRSFHKPSPVKQPYISTMPNRFFQFTSYGLKPPTPPNTNYDAYKRLGETNHFTKSLTSVGNISKEIATVLEGDELQSSQDSKAYPVDDFENSDSTSSFLINETAVAELEIFPSGEKKLSKILEDTLCVKLDVSTEVQHAKKLSLLKNEVKETKSNETSSVLVSSAALDVYSLMNGFMKEKQAFEQRQNENLCELKLLQETFQTQFENLVQEFVTNQKTLLENIETEYGKFKKKFDFSAYLEGKIVTEVPQNEGPLTGTSSKTSGVKRIHKKKVISSKVKRCLINSSGEVNFRSPSVLSSGKRRADKAICNLKASYNCLKTPIKNLKKSPRPSHCYTPHSLSVCIGDQVRDIFEDK